MASFGFAKTANRSVVGTMTEFAFMLDHARDGGRSTEDLVGVARAHALRGPSPRREVP